MILVLLVLLGSCRPESERYQILVLFGEDATLLKIVAPRETSSDSRDACSVRSVGVTDSFEKGIQYSCSTAQTSWCVSAIPPSSKDSWLLPSIYSCHPSSVAVGRLVGGAFIDYSKKVPE